MCTSMFVRLRNRISCVCFPVGDGGDCGRAPLSGPILSDLCSCTRTRSGDSARGFARVSPHTGVPGFCVQAFPSPSTNAGAAHGRLGWTRTCLVAALLPAYWLMTEGKRSYRPCLLAEYLLLCALGELEQQAKMPRYADEGTALLSERAAVS